MAGQSNGDRRRKQQPNIEAGLPYHVGDGYRDPPNQAAVSEQAPGEVEWPRRRQGSV